MKNSKEAVLGEILDLLGQLAEDWDRSEALSAETLIFTELGLESLDAVVLATSIQENYQKEMPFAQLFSEVGERQRDLSVGELADFVRRHLEGKE